jgi:hypothetical protein
MGRPIGTPKTGGRKAGTQNKMTGELKEIILAALDDAGGVDYLKSVAATHPAAFLSLVGKVLPLQVSGDPDSPLFPAVINVIAGRA